MTRLSDARADRLWSDTQAQPRTFAQRAQSHVRRGDTASGGTSTSDAAGQDRVANDRILRAEAPSTVAAGLPISAEEPPAIQTEAPLPPPIYSKGPHYYCPAGFEGTALDPLRLAEEFMALPDELRGNYFNALCQYNPSLGSALNSTLRDIRGADVQKNWLTTMDNRQGSTFSAEGLPPWLLSHFT
ncbi:MAG: hypothetical protein ACAI38_12895 [Myxococcota bacterium]